MGYKTIGATSNVWLAIGVRQEVLPLCVPIKMSKAHALLSVLFFPRSVEREDGEGAANMGARRARGGGEATRFGCACEILSIWDDQVNTRRLTKAVVCRCWTSIERV